MVTQSSDYGHLHRVTYCIRNSYVVIHVWQSAPGLFDPETVALLRDTLDDAWASLRPEQQATIQKTALAERILKSAAEGERDRKRLRDAALMDLAA